MTYQFVDEQQTRLRRLSDGAIIPAVTGNADYADYLAWVASGNAPALYVATPLTQADYAAALQSVVDATAAAKGYNDGTSCASYSASTMSAWAAEAAAFVSWRDAAWTYAYGELAKVQAGTRPQPSVAVLLAELPVIAWPA